MQALKIATAQSESIKLRTVLEQIVSKVSAGSSFYSGAAAFPQIFEFQWIEAIRTGEVTGKMAQVLLELNKQIRDSRDTKCKVKGRHVPHDPDFGGRDCRDSDALAGRADLCQDVRGHGCQAPRHHPVRGGRLTAEVNAQYAAFLSAFNKQLANYVTSFVQQSTGTTPVSATLTSAYTIGSAVIEVDDASVFGPQGTFPTALTASATLGSAPPLGTFILTGSVGNLVTINVAGSSQVNLPVTTSTSSSSSSTSG